MTTHPNPGNCENNKNKGTPKPIEERIAEWFEVECDLANDEYRLMELVDIMECAQDELRKLRTDNERMSLYIEADPDDERDKLRAQLAEAVEIGKQGWEGRGAGRVEALARLSTLAKESGVG